jgi:predicted nucleotidyltransferase component of viral defense system
MRVHEDPALFGASINYTMASTGFLPGLIEKDYFCTLLLEFLTTENDTLVFKGGTCLAKVHTDFYRLSEDLDFSIPTPVAAARSERSRRAAKLKASLLTIDQRQPVFRTVHKLTGENNSTQYSAVVGYRSLVTHREETIKIQAGLRELLFMPSVKAPARTLLLDPVSDQPMMKPIMVQCLAVQEAFAEKFRAALSRRDVAIRDFYDIAYAVGNAGIRPDVDEFVELVRQKLAIPGNEPVDISEKRFIAVRRQVATQLKPVLRSKDFAAFDLEWALGLAAKMALRVSG